MDDFTKKLWLSDRLELLAGVLPKQLTPEIISEYVDQIYTFDIEVLRKAFDVITGEEEFFPSPAIIIQYCNKISRDMQAPQIAEREPTLDEKRRGVGVCRYSLRILYEGKKIEDPEHQAHIQYIFNSPDWRLEDEPKVNMKNMKKRGATKYMATEEAIQAMEKFPKVKPWKSEPLTREEKK